MDDRNRAEHQRLISIADQARKDAEALVVSSREAIACANALINATARRAPVLPGGWLAMILAADE